MHSFELLQSSALLNRKTELGCRQEDDGQKMLARLKESSETNRKRSESELLQNSVQDVRSGVTDHRLMQIGLMGSVS